MEIDANINNNIDEQEYDVMQDRKPVVPENIYLSRGLTGKPSLDDHSRVSQMSCCAKLATCDWVKILGIEEDPKEYKIVEVRFKNSRKEFYILANQNIILETGDIVVVEVENGYDIGLLTLKGSLAQMQFNKSTRKKQIADLKKLLRKATKEDVERWDKSISQEQKTFERSRAIANEQGLFMKINDVEYQGDGTKATFFYTADDRVDFRQLIKIYAAEFKVKIEMRQIGTRQESMRIGGIGICGRELCCVTFLSNFYSVSTQTAKTQQLSQNSQKLAGKCGKLKCCINYEYEIYQEIVKDFPDNEIKLKTQKGDAFWQKTDVFNHLMYYSYYGGKGAYICLPVEKVKEIVALNQKGTLPISLESFSLQKEEEKNQNGDFFSAIKHNEDITRFDNRKSRNRHRPRNDN
ncbi:MAG: hypothetical protein LBC89_00270 [Bacteroidales bacterium]|jgi:cell fate regulator YaaT (PSP1 superfamily)|nr:hypothetical protein [Bacteroidales bacterium]